MRSTISFLSIILLLPFLLVSETIAAKALPLTMESGDRTLSPYFFVKSDDPAVDQLPLKATTAQVNISGVIADVRVTQVYKNEGRNPIEAIYIFPASTKAAVYGMKMTIGERIIEAKIDKREQARRQYEQARAQGKSASLLEQQRPNVFQMNVANILPGDEIQVELRYTELMTPTDGIYEFVYPTVVGPRYSNLHLETTSPSEQWVQNPYLRQEERPTYAFDLTLTLSAGVPIRELFCPSHKVNAVYDGPNIAKVNLEKSETHGGNRDYVLRYRLSGDRIQSGLLLFAEERENFFLLMMQPPKRVRTADIPGREYIFIVDVSGSMHGFPLEMSKKLLKDLIGNLRSSDRFNLLLFSGGSSVMSEQSVPATPENITRAMELINRQRGGGGTELLPALTRALKMPKPENFSRTFVIATDGYVTVEEEVFDLMRNNLGDANMFTFGIGTAVNRHLIEGMARVGMGEPFVISKPEEAPFRAEQFRAMIQSPVLTQIKVKFQDFAAYDVEPPAVPDILAERPVIVFGKWRGRPSGRITLSGISGQGPYTEVIHVANVSPSDENSSLRYLWARHRVALLSGYNRLRADDKRVEEIMKLGLTYNLLTAYTSFVAIDTEVRNKDGNVMTVKQPLPLPQGVSDYAVGGSVVAQAYAPAAKASLPAEHEVSRRQEISKDKAELKSSIVQVTVSEGLSGEEAVKVVKGNWPEIEKACSKTKLQGKATIILILNSEGKVKKINVALGEGKNKETEKCIQEVVKKWQFPARKNQPEVRIEISLQFS
jgi:Ca-activated chloride channel family protein